MYIYRDYMVLSIIFNHSLILFSVLGAIDPSPPANTLSILWTARKPLAADVMFGSHAESVASGQDKALLGGYMEHRFYYNPFVRDHHQEDHPEFDPGSGVDSPSSENEVTKISEPSLKKRKSVEKRVVSVPIIGDVNGGRSKGEAYPPSDSWAWRKYGQKPIKGSPYPRSFKGCPARKQVERSHRDSTMLLITYASDHNHPLPGRHHGRSTPDDSPPPEVSTSEHSGFPGHPDLPPLDLDWLATYAASTSLLETPVSVVDSREMGSVVVVVYGMMRDEDKSLFGDLGELPECLSVFGPRRVAVPEVSSE